MNEPVQVELQGTTGALVRFQGALQQRAGLMKAIAAGQLVSVRRTFDEQGVPANSWAPLAPSTIRNAKSKASAGRKILILSGRLLSSIQSTVADDGIVIGTNLKYARVQQEGSGGGAAKVPEHSRKFLREIHYGTREVNGHHVPVAMRTGTREITDKRGSSTKVRAAYQGPRQQKDVKVGAHERVGGIPARPYLVFRPEDPDRIREQVIGFVQRAAAQTGLQAGGAS